MKKILAIIVLSVFASTAIQAATATAVLGTASRSNLVTGPLTTTLLTVTSSATNNSVIYIWDAPGLFPTNTAAAYSSYSYSVGSGTNYYTNYFNVVTSNTFPALITTSNWTAAAIGTYPVVWSGVTIPTNTTTIFDFNHNFLNGILVSNHNAATITATYTK